MEPVTIRMANGSKAKMGIIGVRIYFNRPVRLEECHKALKHG